MNVSLKILSPDLSYFPYKVNVNIPVTGARRIDKGLQGTSSLSHS